VAARAATFGYTKDRWISSQKKIQAKNSEHAKRKALTAKIVQRSGQTLVLFLQRNVVLGYLGEIFDNMLYQKQQE
jgi:transposase